MLVGFDLDPFVYSSYFYRNMIVSSFLFLWLLLLFEIQILLWLPLKSLHFSGRLLFLNRPFLHRLLGFSDDVIMVVAWLVPSSFVSAMETVPHFEGLLDRFVLLLDI